MVSGCACIRNGIIISAVFKFRFVYFLFIYKVWDLLDNIIFLQSGFFYEFVEFKGSIPYVNVVRMPFFIFLS